MTDTAIQPLLPSDGEEQGIARRRFLRSASSIAVAAGASSLLAACGGGNDPTPTPTATVSPTPSPTSTVTPTPTATDADVLNFALNLKYLQAQFYTFATTGTGLAADQLTGLGTAGVVTGGAAVTFTDPLLQQFALEIAADKRAHVTFLRVSLNSLRVAQPAINIAGDAAGAFTAAARFAGVVGPTETFDPYASESNFLLAAFLLEDIAVTAFKGGAALIGSRVFVEAAAGLLAADAYHSGLIRTVLYQRGATTASLRTKAGQLSDARDTLDGPSEADQGITGDATTSNIVPTDSNGLAFSRSPGRVLNIAYLTNSSVVGGGFFPAGTNGTFKTSSNNGVSTIF